MSRFTISDSGVITVFPSKVKTALIFLGAVIPPLAGVTYLFVGQGVDLPIVVSVGVGLIGIPFFTLCAVYASRRIVFDRPTMVIDREGIIDNGSIVAVGRIAWDEITEIRPYSFSGHKMLGIQLQDAESVFARQSLWKRPWLRANHRLSDFPISIAQSLLPIPVEELVGHIDEYFGG